MLFIHPFFFFFALHTLFKTTNLPLPPIHYTKAYACYTLRYLDAFKVQTRGFPIQLNVIWKVRAQCYVMTGCIKSSDIYLQHHWVIL